MPVLQERDGEHYASLSMHPPRNKNGHHLFDRNTFHFPPKDEDTIGHVAHATRRNRILPRPWRLRNAKHNWQSSPRTPTGIWWSDHHRMGEILQGPHFRQLGSPYDTNIRHFSPKWHHSIATPFPNFYHYWPLENLQQHLEAPECNATQHQRCLLTLQPWA